MRSWIAGCVNCSAASAWKLIQGFKISRASGRDLVPSWSSNAALPHRSCQRGTVSSWPRLLLNFLDIQRPAQRSAVTW